jgi:glucose/arabinose dehydrogenase
MRGILTLLVGLVTVVSPVKADTITARPTKLVPHRISLANGRSFDLNLPEGFAISVAAQGLKRVRFMANSPDNRIFVTDMYNLSDNKRGVVYILADFDPAGKTFKKVTPYLIGLRNPNSIAFYTDPQRVNWFYLALTDRLLRYKYNAGDEKPSGEPEVLATFPDYGLSYKYGGWHLTRTIVVGGNGKIYVSVGSSCNACEEKEAVRASILEIDPDGKNQKHFARGLRNAVGLRWAKDELFATNMGSDHMGDHKPADTMYAVRDGVNYGWPYCFQSGRGRFPDGRFNPNGRKMNCRRVPEAYAAFDAHSSPLGLEYFDAGNGVQLKNSFLVALHGSTKRSLNRGYRVVRISGTPARSIVPEDFITGFLHGDAVHGRPVDVLAFGTDAFLLTDDHAGVVYYVYRR